MLDAKATLSIEGYKAKMFVLKEKDGGTVYVDDEIKDTISSSSLLAVAVISGEHIVKICLKDKNRTHKICGEKNVYVANDAQIS